MLEIMSKNLKEPYEKLHKDYLGYVLIRAYKGEIVEYFKLSELEDEDEYIYCAKDTTEYIIKGDLEEMLEFVSEQIGLDYEELMDSFLESEY